jgi:hypothetical protein
MDDPIVKGLVYMIAFLFITEYCLGVWFGGFMGMAV